MIKKIIFSAAIAIFYVAYIIYDRTYSPKAANPIPVSFNIGSQNPATTEQQLPQDPAVGQVLGTQTAAASGSAPPPADNQATQTAKQPQLQAASQTVVATAAPPSPAPQTAQAPGSQATTPAPAPAPIPVPTPVPTPTPTPTPAPQPQGQYADGSYTGPSADALFGTVQIKAVISGGKLTDVQFLSYPNDNPTSLGKSNMAMPILTQEAIAAQSANVNAVTGASETSQAFIQSLSAALNQAKA